MLFLGSLVGERAHRDLDKIHLNPKPEFRYLLFGAFHVKRYSREKSFRMCTIGFIMIHVSHGQLMSLHSFAVKDWKACISLHSMNYEAEVNNQSLQR